MKRIFIKFLSVLCCLSLFVGCSAEDTEPAAETSVTVYYVNNNGVLSSTGYALEAEGEEGVRKLIEVLQNGQYADGKAAVPKEAVFDSLAWKGSTLTLDFSEGYPAVGTGEEILCRAALVLTLTQLEGLDGVKIRVDGESLKDTQGQKIGVLRADSFLQSEENVPAGAEETEFVLYFASEDGTALVPETVAVSGDEGETSESLVMECLLQGPQESGHKATLPSAAKVSSVTVKDRICYVNFDNDFKNLTLEVSEAIAVYSIVDSLTELPGIDKVQLLIGGSTDVAFHEEISLAAPLDRNEDLIGE